MLAFHDWQEAKVVAVTPLNVPKGPKDRIHSLSLAIEGTMPNSMLDAVSPELRPALFTKPSTAPAHTKARQEGLEGVPQQSDTPSISLLGSKLGKCQWADEQTGCTFELDYGAGGESNIKLGGCRQWKLAFQAIEGGCRFWMTINTSTYDEMDAETYGRVAKLKKEKIRFKLVGPKVEQESIPGTEGAPVTPVTPITPITALAGADAAARKAAAEGDNRKAA